MYIHLLDYTDRNVRMILPPTTDGVAPVVYTYTVSGLTYPTGVTFDGQHLHLLDNWTDNVRMILPPTADGVAPVVHTYTVSGLNDPQGAIFDGQYIHLLDYSDANVRMILPPTAGGVASVIYAYSVSGLTNPTGATFDGKHLHLLDISDDNVRMILPPTADGVAPVVHTYSVSGLNNPQGATFDGKHLHLLDNVDDNVRMILPPTADGVAPVVHTYSVSGLNDPTGATFDGSIAPVIFASSIPNQAWIVGTAITSLSLPEATGGTETITYSLSPTPPAGITFTPGTRVLAGNPTGRFTSATFTYTATAGTESVTLTFTIVVTATFSLDSTIDDQIWTVDEAESLTLPGATGGVGALMFALTGILPTGMTRSNFDVSGTPTEESVLMSFTWTVTDRESVAIQQTFLIIVNFSTVEADRLEAQRIRRQASILPPNATILQVDILHTAIEMLNLHTHETFNGQEEIPIKYLWNPDLCPENALPNLARALSIEIDITQFGVETQRELIKNSFTIHRQKGTIASIRSALETFNISLASDWLVEGRRDINDNIIRENGGWAHFSINIESSIPRTLAQEIVGFLENIAPARSKLVSFTFPVGLAYYNGRPNAEGQPTIFYDGSLTYSGSTQSQTIFL